MQKEIWMADLDPVEGSEQSGFRPVIIISGETMNKHYNVVIICPLTSKVKPYKGCPVINANATNGLKTTSQAIPFHVRTIAKTRLKKKLGTISDHQLEDIQQGLHLFLMY